jgi:hypothetical protein
MWKNISSNPDDIPPIADTGLIEVDQKRLTSKCMIPQEISA